MVTSRIQTEYAYKRDSYLLLVESSRREQNVPPRNGNFSIISDSIENHANAVSRPSQFRMPLPETQAEDEQRLRVRAVSVVHLVLNLICYRIN